MAKMAQSMGGNKAASDDDADAEEVDVDPEDIHVEL